MNRFGGHCANEGFPGGLAGKESTCNSIIGSGRSPGEGIGYPLQYSWASLVAHMVKNLPAMWETWVWSLSWEDPLEEDLATHSLPGESPWTKEPGGLQYMGLQRVGHDWVTEHSTVFLKRHIYTFTCLFDEILLTNTEVMLKLLLLCNLRAYLLF